MPRTISIVLVGLYPAFQEALTELMKARFRQTVFKVLRVDSSDEVSKVFSCSAREFVVVDAKNNRYRTTSPVMLGQRLCERDTYERRVCQRIALADTSKECKELSLNGYQQACRQEELPGVLVQGIRQLLNLQEASPV